MHHYIVTISTPQRRFWYHAIGESSAAVACCAQDAFGPCGVTVRVQP